MSGRLSQVAAAALLVGAAAACAVLLNMLLLGTASAQNDPVGRLTQHPHAPAAPAWVVRPSHGRVKDAGADD